MKKQYRAKEEPNIMMIVPDDDLRECYRAPLTAELRMSFHAPRMFFFSNSHSENEFNPFVRKYET